MTPTWLSRTSPLPAGGDAGAGTTLESDTLGAVQGPSSNAPTELLLSPVPATVLTGVTLTYPVYVAAEDSGGSLTTDLNENVTVTAVNTVPSVAAALGGTTTVAATNGIAQFSALTPVTGGYLSLKATSDTSDVQGSTNVFTVEAVPPTLTSFGASVANNTTLSFTGAEFTSAFSDSNPGASLQTVEITALPTEGSLAVSGAPATVGETIPIADVSADLLYTPNVGYTGPDSFGRNGSDGTNYATAAIGANFASAANLGPTVSTLAVDTLSASTQVALPLAAQQTLDPQAVDQADPSTVAEQALSSPTGLAALDSSLDELVGSSLSGTKDIDAVLAGYDTSGLSG